ncbi:MAG: DUF983 domain-containing protein [Acidimicrobiia bacterium]
MEHAGRFTSLMRGLTLRCARCGAGHLFRRWFTMVDDCPGCGLHFEREQGYFAGALAINIIAATMVFFVCFIGGLLLMWPDVNVAILTVSLIVVNAAFPIFFYPFSKTIWVAVDRAFLQRLDRNEALDEQIETKRRAVVRGSR